MSNVDTRLRDLGFFLHPPIPCGKWLAHCDGVPAPIGDEHIGHACCLWLVNGSVTVGTPSRGEDDAFDIAGCWHPDLTGATVTAAVLVSRFSAV